MINVYKTDESRIIRKMKKIEDKTWIDLINPTTNEIKKIVKSTGLPENLIIKLLDTEELPRIENEDDATLIVVDFPFREDKKDKNNYATMPLGIITNKNYIVTVSLKEVEVLSEMKDNKTKVVYTAKRTRFIIQLLHRVSISYIKYLNIINQEIELKEKVLIKSTSNKDLLSLMNLQKSLVYFTTSLKANHILLEKLSKGSIFKLYEEDADLLEDAIIESKQGIETANIYREILASISDTYATVISNNLNGIMKFLAGITIVSTIPTMIASFMGMNVPLGDIEHNNYALYIIIFISILFATIIAVILKKKDML